ncbi:M16 family metallopeptidase [Mesorhizobium koreense]|uniref:M16 family metallopeptidase n=1 Tax=Mesorhizobium koreense TaxID=3074855 RepID=UPI00287B8790|nr:pitrilysin family protein [Mesorhizobium sp. WR6]
MTDDMALMRRLSRAIVFLALTVAFAAPSLPAFAKAPEESARISDFTLANGLEVVVIPDHRAPVVTHMIWYKAGSADEAAGKSGIAHFFEHLMFKGTKNHPPGEFSRKVAEIGGQENAFTSYDYTAFYQQVAPSALETMMRYEADRMRNLTLTDAVIGPERNVILEERRMRIDNNPGAVLDEEVNATLYQNSPYRYPVIGWKQEIEKLNRADAVAFYDHFYEPNNAVVVVAGDVDAATVREYAEETYGKVPRGADLPPRNRPQEPEQNTRRTVTLNDPRVTVPSFSKKWVVPSYESAEPGVAESLDLLAEILGGGVRSRLYQDLIVNKGIAASAGAYYQGTAIDPSSFGVYASPLGGAKLADVEKAADAEIARIVKDGVSADELAKAKKRFVRGMIFARDNQAGMARLYGAALATGSTVEDVEKWPDRIEAVTAEQVKEAAKYLDPSRSVTGYLLPPEQEVN